MDVSAVLACRNEEPFIRFWLETTATYAREILIAVHAPTDATVDVIAEFKARSPIPVHCEWFPARTVERFGYSLMKNEMLARARGEWIVNLDADEEIGLSPAELAQALEAATAAGRSGLSLWWAEHPCPEEVPADWTIENRERLRSAHRRVLPALPKCKVFRNRSGFWWRGIIHEAIVRHDRNGLEFCHDVGAVVHHYGYLRRPEPEWKRPLYCRLICLARDHPNLGAAVDRFWHHMYDRTPQGMRDGAARYAAGRDAWFPDVPRRSL